MSLNIQSDSISAAETQAMLIGIYEENGRTFRHFLSWRRLMFAGYFAVLAGINLALDGSTRSDILFPAAGLLISVVFLLLDLRNRALIGILSEAGENLERELNLHGVGHYSIYRDRAGALSHTTIAVGFYCVMILIFLALSIQSIPPS
jgi:hypothetical membrane protein